MSSLDETMIELFDSCKKQQKHKHNLRQFMKYYKQTRGQSPSLHFRHCIEKTRLQLQQN